MADFKTPNLCGASEALNNASSKIENLINEIDLKIDSVASEAAAAFNNKLNEVKAGLDGLAIDIPKLPAVNFQSEITNLINNVDKTTAQGFAEFTSKLAEIEKDFGDVLTEKGLSIDKLITDATTKLGGGGNLCDLVPNLEIPAGNSGTGVTTEEKEERGSGTSITISETPKEIISLQGKRAGTSFFGNVTYKQSGKTLTTTQIDNDNNLVSYTELKVKYIISLIKEKPVAAKQAAVPSEKEELSIVTTNSNAVDTKTFSTFTSALKKLNTKSVLGLATEKEKTDLEAAISSIGSPTLKSKMDADFAKANAFLSGKGPGTLSGEVTSSLNGPTDSNGKSNTIKVTTPESASTVTKEVITKVNPVTKRQETIEVKKTVKAPVSTVGFTNRKVEITEQFYTSTLPSNVDVDIEEMKLIEKGYDLLLKYSPVSIVDIEARAYNSDGINFFLYQFQEGQLKESNVNNIIPAFTPPKNLFLQPKELDSNVLNINVVSITYRILEKLDPSVKG
tara:strand:- start:2628 stop:4148 length:1521 start_codon:yes stop_codon:yes gene_type:complete